jgi:HK97 family phage portal protein
MAQASFIRRLCTGFRSAATSAGTTLGNPATWFTEWATGSTRGGEVSVNEHTALNYLAVYDCVSLISATIARLPLLTYRKEGKRKIEATDHSVYPLLLRELNPRMSAMTGRELVVAHLLTWGNSYSQIIRNRSGSRVLQINPIGPDVVKPRLVGAEIVYDVFKRSTRELLGTYGAKEMLHVPGLGFDGITGYSPIRVAKSTIKAGIAQDLQGERFVTRGIRPPGAIKWPQGKRFKDKQEAIRWRNDFREIHATGDSDLNVLVLEDGAEWQNMGMDPKSAQLLESRKYSKLEICGLYRTPPHMIGIVDVTSSWGTGVAEQTQAWINFCLLDWMRRIEQEFSRKLFDDPAMFVAHDLDELLAGDLLKRTQARQIQHMRGIITDNDWRELEGWDPVTGGDVRHFPLAEGRIDANGEILPAVEGSSSATPPAIPEPPSHVDPPAPTSTKPTQGD